MQIVFQLVRSFDIHFHAEQPNFLVKNVDPLYGAYIVCQPEKSFSKITAPCSCVFSWSLVCSSVMYVAIQTRGRLPSVFHAREEGVMFRFYREPTMSAPGKPPTRQPKHHVSGYKVFPLVSMAAGLQVWVGRPSVAALLAGNSATPEFQRPPSGTGLEAVWGVSGCSWTLHLIQKNIRMQNPVTGL